MATLGKVLLWEAGASPFDLWDAPFALWGAVRDSSGSITNRGEYGVKLKLIVGGNKMVQNDSSRRGPRGGVSSGQINAGLP
jgi:hypothetical protein